ncbi:MAG: OsmC family peroxiredoxin [Leucobacter sp.]
MPKTIVNKASTVWNGDLFTGSGTTSLDTSGQGTFDVAWKSRGEESGGVTTPEELIASAHATCFSMNLANTLAENGTPPTKLNSSAEVSFVAGTGITAIHLTVVATVDGLDAADFQRLAEKAERTCPVSMALAGVKDITLSASLA